MVPNVIFEHHAPTAWIFLALAAAVAVTVFSFWRHLSFQWRDLVLCLLRFVILALLGWCLLLPMRQRVLTETVKSRFLVALDTSASMALVPSGGRDAASNRWSVARGILSQDWTRRMQDDCHLDVFPFDSDIRTPVSLADAASLVPAGTSTQLREALRKILERHRGQNMAGLLLLSDGLDTQEVHEDWAKEKRPCPIYTVRLETPGIWETEPDLRLESLDTPRRVVMGWDTKLTAIVAGQGVRGKPFEVQLWKNGQREEIQPAQLPDEGGSHEVTFRLHHPEIGAFNYTVVVPPLPGETHTNDNAFSIDVQVVDARNRLLYAEGPPRWESKYLVRELKANKNITPVAFVRGPNQQFLSYTDRGTMTLDMTAAQLALYKIVILGDLDAEAIGDARADALLKFVENGGSLVLLGGPAAWVAKGFAASGFAKALPIQRPWGDAPVEGTYPVRLSEEGRAHPVFRADQKGWDRLPPVLSVYGGAKLSAGATVLVEAETPAGTQPLLVSQRYGQGKVVAILTDSLWRWQLDPGKDRPYARFWSQVVEWMSPTETSLEAYELELLADTGQVSLGETIALKARLSGRGELPVGAQKVVCEIRTPDDRRIPLAMAKQEVAVSGASYPGYAAAYAPQASGLHKAVASMEVNGHRIDSAPFSFFVKAFTPESLPRPANEKVLRALAVNSGGWFCEAADVNRVLSALDVKSRQEQRVEFASLWQRLGMIAVLLGLLVLDWVIRKARNMA